MPNEASPSQIRDLGSHGVPWDKRTVPDPKTAPGLRCDCCFFVAGTNRADQVSPFRYPDSHDITGILPDPVGFFFDPDNIPTQHVFGPTNRHLRFFFKGPGTRGRSNGERDDDSTYDVEVALSSSLLATDDLHDLFVPFVLPQFADLNWP